MSKIIAAVAAHPDDEVLGAGGTLARLAGEGHDVHVIFMADGVSSRGSDEGAEERRKASYDAMSCLGVPGGNIHFFSFPDNKMDSVPLLDITQELEGVLRDINPQIVYTHHAGDLNVDHRLTNEAVLTACRPQPDSRVETIYGFEVLSSTDWGNSLPSNAFLPNCYVDITGFMNYKVKALQAYEEEMRDAPHARSLEAADALATFRGHHIGREKAEAFQLIRMIT